MTNNILGWHPADIRSAIAKGGASLSSIARDAGISPRTTSKALQEPCFAGEQAIAAFLKTPAHRIWPGRYDSAGTPKHPRIHNNLNVPSGTNKRQKEVAA